MKLRLDGIETEVQPGQSLLDLVQLLRLDHAMLSQRPLAAKIAGEVFTLNYIPFRKTDDNSDRPSIRRAMAASNGEVKLLHYGDEAGKEAYIRTAQFVIFLAFHQLWPDATVKMNCTVGASVYMQVIGAEDFSVSVLSERVASIVSQDIPLLRRRVPYNGNLIGAYS